MNEKKFTRHLNDHKHQSILAGESQSKRR